MDNFISPAQSGVWNLVNVGIRHGTMIGWQADLTPFSCCYTHHSAESGSVFR